MFVARELRGHNLYVRSGLGEGRFGRVYKVRDHSGVNKLVKVALEHTDLVTKGVLGGRLPPPPAHPERVQLLRAWRVSPTWRVGTVH